MKHGTEVAEVVESAEMVALTNEAQNLVEAGKTMYGVHYGESYKRGMSTKEAAAEIRKTLRSLSKSKHSALSGAKVSVRYESFSGGSAVRVKLGLAYQTHENDEEAQRLAAQEGRRYRWLTEKASAAQEAAEEVHNAYNFDGSDIMTDYFHVNYYGQVDVYEICAVCGESKEYEYQGHECQKGAEK